LVTFLLYTSKFLKGTKRTREEFIPYLIDIIEDQENEDDFLILLCDEIVKLKDYIGGKEHLNKLLGPLEIIGCMEETTVRQRAVDNLIKLSKEDTESFCKNCLFLTIKKFAAWNNYMNKVSAASLLPICYPHVSEEQQKELLNVFI